MKRLLIITMSIISSIGFTSPLLAQTRVSTTSQVASEVIEISPYDLATSAYQGRFVNQGIPSYGRFISAVRSRKITAKDLVEVAISQRRLSSETLNNKRYFSNVKSILNSLDKR